VVKIKNLCGLGHGLYEFPSLFWSIEHESKIWSAILETPFMCKARRKKTICVYCWTVQTS